MREIKRRNFRLLDLGMMRFFVIFFFHKFFFGQMTEIMRRSFRFLDL